MERAVKIERYVFLLASASYGAKYSRMDQVKFVEDSHQKIELIWI